MRTFLKITGAIVLLLVIGIAAFIGYAAYKIRHIKDPHNLQVELDNICNDYISTQKSVGLCIGIVQGDTVYIKGYGQIDKDKNAVPDSNTIFEIGSISKVFTAEIAEILVQRGLLSWDDPIEKYLAKEVHLFSHDKTTLLNLVTHTSGFPRVPEMWFPKMTNDCDPYSTLTIQDLYLYLDSCKDKKASDLKNYDYSNLGMGLLGHIAEWRSGRTYEELLQELICKPLQMEHTTTQLKDSNNFASGYDEKAKKTCHWNFPVIYGAGAIRSNMSDMLRFLKANIGNTNPLSDTLKLSQKQVTLIPMGGIGHGWHIDKVNGILSGIRQIIWHNGGTGGFRSYMGFVPGKKRGIIVLANQVNDGFDDLAIKLIIQANNNSLQ